MPSYRRKDAPRVHRCYRPDCSKVFSYKSDNHRHWKIRSHLDIKDYQCQICLKEFCQEQQLQNHLRGKNVHRVNAEESNDGGRMDGESPLRNGNAQEEDSPSSEPEVSESEESEPEESEPVESEESEAEPVESEESEAEPEELESENDNDELPADNSSMGSDDERVSDHTAEGELHHDSDIIMDEAPNDDLPLRLDGGNENAEAVNGQDDEMRRDTDDEMRRDTDDEMRRDSDEESVLTDLSEVYRYQHETGMDIFGPNYFKDLPSSGDSESEDRGDPPRNLESPQRF